MTFRLWRCFCITKAKFLNLWIETGAYWEMCVILHMMTLYSQMKFEAYLATAKAFSSFFVLIFCSVLENTSFGTQMPCIILVQVRVRVQPKCAKEECQKSFFNSFTCFSSFVKVFMFIFFFIL